MKKGEVRLFGYIPRGEQMIDNVAGMGARASCRYCGKMDTDLDIYIVARNGRLEGFCLPCYEIHLDDKNASERDAKGTEGG
jgi:hypothetical protein